MKHTCHWPSCKTEVPPKMWGCKKHWFTLPQRLRNAIWATYRPGQEISKTPSELYLQVATVARIWAFHHIWEHGTDEEKEIIRPAYLEVCNTISQKREDFEWPEGLRAIPQQQSTTS